jgi:hypothetical protein
VVGAWHREELLAAVWAGYVALWDEALQVGLQLLQGLQVQDGGRQPGGWEGPLAP